jgi:hypothetical protein
MTSVLKAGRFLPALAAAALLASASTAFAVDADRQYLRDKISFRYVDQPNNVAQAPEVLDNIGIFQGTESGGFWSSNSVPRLKGVVRALLKESGKGGDGNLQYVAARILKVLDKPVIIILINDKGPALTAAAFRQWDACDDGSGNAWPCASNMATSDDARAECARSLGRAVPARRDAWAGQMSLGETSFAGDLGWATSTFIHELVHTQDRSDGRAHMFWVSGQSYRYGADGTHYHVEAVPNLAMTYKEGIANTMRLVVNEARRQEMFRWFANNDVVLVEQALVPPGTGPGALPCTAVTAPSADVWLYQQLKAAGAHEVTANPNPNPGYAAFKIRDIPPRFIVHNEYILALTFSEYARHLGLAKFMAALKTNDATLFRVSTSPVAQLYNTLCFAGLNGRPLASVVGVNEAGPKPYLIPLAYADYFTGYKAQSKADFAAIFEGMLRQEWVDLYWDGYKDNVRSTVPIDATHQPKFENLTDISIALGVNQSEPE